MWNKTQADELLKSFPIDKKKSTLDKMQQAIDVQKYCASYDLGFDLCGFYGSFCEYCDKSVKNPCANAFVKMMEEKAKSEEVAVSLSDSLKSLKNAKTDGAISKKSIAKYLKDTYGDKVVVNERENYIPNGKLPLPDTHFVKGAKKDACFTYVYENKQGKVLLLIKTDDMVAKAVKSAHPSTRNSKFPKSKKAVWLSVPVDATFTEKDVFELLDVLVKA